MWEKNGDLFVFGNNLQKGRANFLYQNLSGEFYHLFSFPRKANAQLDKCVNRKYLNTIISNPSEKTYMERRTKTEIGSSQVVEN